MTQILLAKLPVPDAARVAYDLPASARHVHLVQQPLGPGRWARTLHWLVVRELGEFTESLE